VLFYGVVPVNLIGDKGVVPVNLIAKSRCGSC